MRFPQRCFFLVTSLFFSGFASAQSMVANSHDSTQKGKSLSIIPATSVNSMANRKERENLTAGSISAKAGDTLSVSRLLVKQNRWSGSVEARTTGTTNGVVPFWMRADQYGSIPLAGASGSLIGRVARDYNTTKSRFLDWGMAVEARANVGKTSNVTLIEGFAKVKLGPFDIRGGRIKSFNGLVDSTLSSGAFSESGNALGIPRVEIIVPEFYPFFGGKLFAFKGNLAHGWIGEVRRNIFSGTANASSYVNTYYHQKSFYGRFGKPTWKVRLYGGFTHQAFWGNEKIRYGSFYSLSTWQTYWYVFRGAMWEGISSKIGNHLGSIDLGLELNLKNTSLFFYRQSFYDIGALYYLANIKDGLHGLRIENKAKSHQGFQWHKILFEFLYSKSQAGEPSSPNTKSGAEDYYNSSEYPDGWSYKGEALGNPFLSTKVSTRTGFPSDPSEYFNNNRVVLFHTGMEGQVDQFNFQLKLSYSKNYGTWATSSYGKRTGGSNIYVIPPIYGVFKPVNQFSSYLLISRTLKDGMTLGGAFALDQGGLLYNSTGLEIRLAKSF
jgi:hypothetical protein